MDKSSTDKGRCIEEQVRIGVRTFLTGLVPMRGPRIKAASSAVPSWGLGRDIIIPRIYKGNSYVCDKREYDRASYLTQMFILRLVSMLDLHSP